MNHLIGISGKMGSGKDEIANIIRELAGGVYEIKKFAYKVKLVASLLIGVDVEKFEDQEFKKTNLSSEWDKNKIVEAGHWEDYPKWEKVSMTVRELLQKIGTDAMRGGLHKQTWVNALFADYTKHDSWLITDVRFENEVKSIKDRGGIVIRVNRELESNNNLHLSETALDTYRGFDYTIDNNGTLIELKQKVEQIWKDCQQLESSL